MAQYSKLILLNKLVKHSMHLSALAALATTTSAIAQDNTNNAPLPETTLDTIVVTANTESADGPVNGLAASTSSSVTGFDESILKSTQSVSVVGQQEIETIGATDMYKALGYSTGINAASPTEKTTIDYYVRGFSGLGSYRDGQKYQANRFNGQQELYGLERIEVIKGPNSVLDGSMPPGGMINTVTKKPYFANGYEVNAEVGSFNHKQVSTDLNHKVNDDIAVRVVGVYKKSDHFIDYVPDDRTYIAPSLTWQPSDDTKLTLQADYQNINTMYIYDLPAEGTVKETVFGKIPRQTFVGIPDFDKYDNDRYTIGYEVSHNITPDLEIKNNLRYMKSDYDFPITYRLDGVEGNKRLYQRSVTTRHDTSKTLTGNLSAKYDWSFGDVMDNITLFGVNYTQTDHSSERADATASNIDIFKPDRSQDKITSKFGDPRTWKAKANQTGIYLQNQLTYNDALVALVGLRHDKVEIDSENFIFGNQTDAQHGDYSATTGRFGLAYLMANGIAPYTSFSQSFEPQEGTDRHGKLFKPTRGKQYEVGVRYQPVGSDTLLTGSAFHIGQTNVLATDPVDDKFEIQLGKVRSQGIELEAKTAINESTNLIAAYTYTDAKTIKSSPATPELEGVRVESVPYNKFSLWGDYRFVNFGIPQLKVGAGVRYTGGTLSKVTKIDVPSYTLVDAMASYDWSDNLKLSLNVNNLLDKEYVTCAWDCNYGEPRNIVGKVTYKW